jgi:hypothetical protein
MGHQARAPDTAIERLGGRGEPCPERASFYAGLGGWTLARAHARSGDPIAIDAYLGPDDTFDRAIGNFAKRYADQNEVDYKALLDAIKDGRLQAVEGV